MKIWRPIHYKRQSKWKKFNYGKFPSAEVSLYLIIENTITFWDRKIRGEYYIVFSKTEEAFIKKASYNFVNQEASPAIKFLDLVVVEQLARRTTLPPSTTRVHSNPNTLITKMTPENSRLCLHRRRS